jgi:hypothetical protein
VKIRAAQATTTVLFALVMGGVLGHLVPLSRTMDKLSAETLIAVGHQSKASNAVVDNAKALGRTIALNPSELRAVPAIAWQRVVDTFRLRKGCHEWRRTVGGD